MIRSNLRRRRQARRIAGAGTVAAAMMLTTSIAGLLGGASTAHAVAASGVVTLTPVAGGAPTGIAGSAEFSIAPPAGAACPGTGAAGYRFHAFIVSASVDTSTMKYDATGPIVSGGAFGAPQYTTAGAGVVNLLPAVSPVGVIDGIPTVSYAVYSPGDIAAGQYKVGVSCTLNNETVSFWQSVIKVEADGGDATGIKWSLDETPAPTATTTTTTTTTTIAPATTTTVVTTTTVHATATTAPATTTTVAATTTSAGGTTTQAPTEAQVLAMSVASLGVSTQVTAGQQVTMTYSGLPSGAAADIYIASTPVRLASTTATSDGRISTSVTIPSTMTGEHSLALVVPSANVAVRQSISIVAAPTTATATTTPTVAALPVTNQTLATTGSSPLPILIWAALLLVFGRMVILLGRPLRLRSPGKK
ncbi:MAG: hypothetical protein JWN39_2109 [Ilumatobacteraceae bacterium]|nr:hypothetical protein [Ilumatobacteraceae bacterium]